MRTGNLSVISGAKLTADIIDKHEINIMLNAFRIAVNDSLTRFNMVDGVVDEFEDESGINTTASIKQSYDATGDFYSPFNPTTSTKLLLHFDGQNNITSFFDSSATDKTVSGFNGALTSTAQFKFGGSALFLDGVNDYLSVPDSADWDIMSDTTTSYTIDCWIRPSVVTGDRVICSQFEGPGNNGTWYFRQEGAGINLTVFNQAGVFQASPSMSAGSVFTVNTWHHVALIKVGNKWGLYVNGLQKANSLNVTFTMNLTSALYIGQRGDTSQFFNGYIDEFRVVKGANPFNANPNGSNSDSFTVPTSFYRSDKILLHFNGANNAVSTIDSSPTSKSVSFFGNSKLDTATKKFGQSSLSLDDTGDYLTIPDSNDWDFFKNLTATYTIDFWVKHNTIGTSKVYMGSGATDSDSWFFQRQSNGTLRLFFRISGNTFSPTSTATIADTNFHHVVLFIFGNIAAIYLDGQQIAHGTRSTTADFNFSLVIGTSGNAASPPTPSHDTLDGYIDELRVCNFNPFSANPNSGLTDVITVPTSEHRSGIEDMTLRSNSSTAQAQPSTSRLIIFEEDVEAVDLNTDLKGYISRDNGTTFTQVTLADEGNYEASRRVLTGSIDISSQPVGTSMVLRLETVNRNLKIHGVALAWD